MNISGRSLFGTATSVAVALLIAVGCGAQGATSSGTPTTTGASVSTPATSPSTAPTMPASNTVTPTVEKPVTVTPPPTPTATKAPSTSPAKPVKPNGPTLKVKSHERDTGFYPEYVKKDPRRPAPQGYKGHPLICGDSNQDDKFTSVPIVLKLNDTTPTGGKNFVSTLVTEHGLLIFPEKGSVLPSDTLIANELLYGNVPAPLLDPTYSSDYSILLSSDPVKKEGWGKITEMVICRKVAKK